LKWLNNIFKKENTAHMASEASGLRLSELDAWLDEKSQNPELERKVKEIYVKIAYVAEDLALDIRELKSASPDKSAPPRLLNAGLAARDALITHMKGMSETLVPPSMTDVSSAVEYHSRMVKSLGNTVLKFGRAQKYVAALFPGQAEKLNSNLNRISHLLVDLNDIVGISQRELLETNASKELLAEVRDRTSQIRALKNNLKDAEKRLSDHRASEIIAKSKLEELKSSEKGQRTKALKEALDLKLLDRTRVETEMAELISPLTKAVARLVKQDASDRLELQYRRAFELLSKSPQDVVDRNISGPLIELRSKVDLLGLKDKKREKILDHLDRLIKDQPLETLKAKHTEISGVIKDLERELSESSQGTTELEETISQISQQIEKLEASVEETKKSLLIIEGLVSKDETELKERLEKIAGKPVPLDMER
jgi:DNA repair exonuclease SbcCD ATPase subunit